MSDYWEENGIKKPDQYIVCAACKVGDIIFCGARHWDMVMRSQAQAAGYMKHAPRAIEEGFIDQFGEFISREDALKIVLNNKQGVDMDRNGSSIDLYSEGLY